MKFQAPKGTRDFYPEDMAWRNHLINAWRRVSIRNGFDEVDGPLFESLDLYKVKSGEGIVTELFHFEDRGGRELALRPEFTPTLARMVAAQGGGMAKPIKWFCVPNFCRAEKPQRGRFREFWQWNCDILGLDGPEADAELIFTIVDLFRELGVGPEQVRIKISHRQAVRSILRKMGVGEEQMLTAFDLLDRRDKIEHDEFVARAGQLGLDEPQVDRFDQICRMKYPAGDLERMRDQIGLEKEMADLESLDAQLAAFGVASWCEYDLGIVRGLAYYTGTVFEMHEVSGMERAIAGGGRYDNLIELFGGSKMSAVGFGMGDAVITNVLTDKGLMPEHVMPRPDVFVVAASDTGAGKLYSIVAALRRADLHTRMSYKTTRNVGKLLKEAAGARARYAVILDDEVTGGAVAVKDLDANEQLSVPVDELVDRLRRGVLTD